MIRARLNKSLPMRRARDITAHEFDLLASGDGLLSIMEVNGNRGHKSAWL